jgi:hypothetical protein
MARQRGEVPTGDLAGKDIHDEHQQQAVATVSPRAVDKRARPGNEAGPAPVGPPAALSAADFDPVEPVEAEADNAEVSDAAKD